MQKHIFPLLTELKQICNFSKEQSKSPKSDLLLEYVKTIAENKKKVLIYSQYVKEGTTKIAKLLDQENIQYVLYTGDVSQQQKDLALSDFRSNPEIIVFLATIQTAGYGITLTEATYVIHFDHPWNPAQMYNAEDRTHRIGQKFGVTIYSFWMRGTVEERIKKKLIEKNLLVESTVDELAIEVVKNSMSTEDWLEIFGVKPIVKTVQPEVKSTGKTQSESNTKQSLTKSRSFKSSRSKSSQSTTSTIESNQMLNDRIKQIEKNLTQLREQVSGKEDTLITIAPEERVRIKQQIKELKLEMKPFEEEYWQILAERSIQEEISEPEAKVVVSELISKVGELKTSDKYPDEVLQMLQRIHLEVSKPGVTAAAKLKGALSMFPPFISLGYEAEIDTESFFRTHLPTFTKWYKAFAKK